MCELCLTGRLPPPKTPGVLKTGPEVYVVLCSCPESEASRLATAMVEERLAACVNIVPAVRSVYRWEGKVHNDAESLLVIKTAVNRFAPLKERLIQLHPYDVPEVLALSASEGHEDYLSWILGTVRPIPE